MPAGEGLRASADVPEQDGLVRLIADGAVNVRGGDEDTRRRGGHVGQIGRVRRVVVRLGVGRVDLQNAEQGEQHPGKLSGCARRDGGGKPAYRHGVGVSW